MKCRAYIIHLENCGFVLNNTIRLFFHRKKCLRTSKTYFYHDLKYDTIHICHVRHYQYTVCVRPYGQWDVWDATGASQILQRLLRVWFSPEGFAHLSPAHKRLLSIAFFSQAVNVRDNCWLISHIHFQMILVAIDTYCDVWDALTVTRTRRRETEEFTSPAWKIILRQI